MEKEDKLVEEERYAAPARTTSDDSNTICRSTSVPSSSPPTSYAVLMREQNATVWCKQSQHEDPEVLARQKAAKKRAMLEVYGGGQGGGRGSTVGSASLAGKLRHNGAQVARGYTPASLIGAGVPMRLSADWDEEDEESPPPSQGPLRDEWRSVKASLNPKPDVVRPTTVRDLPQ